MQGIGINKHLKSKPPAFKFTSQSVFNFPENSEDSVCEITTNKFSAAPAPIGATLIPDAIGANSVTWYYKAFFATWDVDHFILRSEYAGELSFTIGDDTTVIYTTVGAMPEWATSISFVLGQVSGVYTHSAIALGIELSEFYFMYGSNFFDSLPYKYVPAEIHLGYPAPAPDISGITITPNAVGANPVTWYWRALYSRWEEGIGDTFRSQISSNVGSFTIGDDTTTLIAVGYESLSLPFWSTYITIILGTVSDVITHGDSINLLNGNINYFIGGEFTILESLSYIEAIPLKYHPIPVSEQAPAPTNISITPDAIGDNPVTWYYRVLQGNTLNQSTEISDEQSYQQGDATTELIFDLDHINYDDIDIFLIVKGTTSGHYTNAVVVSFTPPDIVVPIADVQLPFNLLTGVDLQFGEEVINSNILNTSPLLLYYYDNELFALSGEGGNELSFISPPDYETPLDTDKDNVYKVLVVGSHGGKNIEQEIEITVTDVEE